VLRVTAPRSARGSLRYRVQVAPARADDTAPGRFIPNHGRVRNRLRGNRVDVVDLYRFDVVTRSDLRLTLDARSSSAFDLVLLNYGGRRLRCACGSSGSQVITMRVRPGRYFAAVRARDGTRGRYALRRLSRTITSAATSVNGVRFGSVAPGASLRVTVDITPAVSGPVTIVVERFDPLAGWQFAAQRKVRAIAGHATLTYRPPRLGRWRFFATFDGTRTASPSVAPVARVLVAEPLRE
jgi:hypothetical protein